MLDWLAQVLRLILPSAFIFIFLACGHAPTERPPVTAAVSATLQALLDAVPYPAYAVSAHWTVVAWNKAALLVIGDFEHLSAETGTTCGGCLPTLHKGGFYRIGRACLRCFDQARLITLERTGMIHW